MLEAIHEQRSVRQPGERIVERLMVQLLLEGFALGDVKHKSLPVAGSARLLEHNRFVTHPYYPAVATDHTVLRGEDFARLSGALILGLQPLAVVRMHHAPPEIRVFALLGGV